MKLIYILLILLIFCGTTTATMDELDPYTIRIIVWDIDGNFENNVPITFVYNEQSEKLYTAEDGTLSFSTLNFQNIEDGSYINVSCKYGTKEAPINYKYGITGVTFNEPDEATSIAMWAAMGFGVISLGGGIYYLIRKPKEDEDDAISR